jgi:hypothetical protein
VKAFVAESGIEEVCLEYFADLGWQVLHGPDIAPGGAGGGAVVYRDVLLEGRLRAAVAQLNPQLAPEDVSEVVATARRAESADLLAENWRVHGLVTNGVPVERRTAYGEWRMANPDTTWPSLSTLTIRGATTLWWSTRSASSRTKRCGARTCRRSSMACHSR